MKQIVCDICGKVIKGTYSVINLPSMHGGEVIQSIHEETARDFCKPCALELYSMIEKFIKDKKKVAK